ncbi:MAG: methyltransferase domain-containing protein [Chloroflexi bacterium]|nr:methyltransferase domain-containing protein [Chloroflexota bacterium]
MAAADRLRWNVRYLTGAAEERAPVRRLVDLAPVIRPASRDGSARALDLACGAGRHTLYLASLGYTVDALDVSDVGLARLARVAAALGLAGRVRLRQVDLDRVQLSQEAYDLVLDTYFLDRRLFRAMHAALKPNGLLFVETLLSTPAKPGRPAYYLQPGELRRAFPGLAELFYEEKADEWWAALLARRTPS